MNPGSVQIKLCPVSKIDDVMICKVIRSVVFTTTRIGNIRRTARIIRVDVAVRGILEMGSGNGEQTNVVRLLGREAARSACSVHIGLGDVVKAILANEISTVRAVANRCSLYGPHQIYRRPVTVLVQYQRFSCLYKEHVAVDGNKREKLLGKKGRWKGKEGK